MSEKLLPNFNLDGKRALVTGAGRGIGLAIAKALSYSVQIKVRQREQSRRSKMLQPNFVIKVLMRLI
ncbi:MAG: hypothetical protein KTR16_00865 [Acidiferrobacterales bacterium]|nr:hypothetical protein [Acidiferrobacterales bacterium]